MSEIRPLPQSPSIEFERKEAKALLRTLRVDDPDARTRASLRHPDVASRKSDDIKLADAQLIIAREYGFASWPKMVRYFGEVNRQRYRHSSGLDAAFYESRARSLLDDHRARRMFSARLLAAYVPRFYGMRAEDVFNMTVNELEVRQATARQYGAPTWESLLERTSKDHSTLEREQSGWAPDAMQLASAAMDSANVEELQRIVDQHRELLQPSARDIVVGRTIGKLALDKVEHAGMETMRPVVAWLASVGVNFQHVLNAELCGRLGMPVERVRTLLELGANANWVAPNGIPVLEHALIRYWNAEAVDVLAARATPRRALWISAGLGDVDGVASFLDKHGKPTQAARELRPEFDAVGPISNPASPDPDDEELLMEAFLVAMLNNRTNVLDYMIARGAPVNSLLWDSPVINIAIGNRMVAVVECLIRGGADLDMKGRRPDQSAREMAQELLESVSDDKTVRIAELCGLDTAGILAALRRTPPKAPQMHKSLIQALNLANADAQSLGQEEVRAENLLFGLLRAESWARDFFKRVGKLDGLQFQKEFSERLLPTEGKEQRVELPLTTEARAIVDNAFAIATERRRDVVGGHHLLWSLTKSTDGFVAHLLTRYGSSAATLHEALDKGI